MGTAADWVNSEGRCWSGPITIRPREGTGTTGLACGCRMVDQSRTHPRQKIQERQVASQTDLRRMWPTRCSFVRIFPTLSRTRRLMLCIIFAMRWDNATYGLAVARGKTNSLNAALNSLESCADTKQAKLFEVSVPELRLPNPPETARKEARRIRLPQREIDGRFQVRFGCVVARAVSGDLDRLKDERGNAVRSTRAGALHTLL